MKRRRRENRTDYKSRVNLLKSGIPRIVVRRTNKYFILQAVESVEAQDKVLATITSKDLLKNGWDKKKEGSLKSIPAGYLTGLLMAKKLAAARGIPSRKGAKAPASSGKGKFIVDLGMARTSSASRVFAVIKGLVDGGLDIPANEKAFPVEDRLNGAHLKEGSADMIAKVKEKLK